MKSVFGRRLAKAVEREGSRGRRTQSLQSLLALLPDDIISDRVVSAADILSPYAVANRYPGDAEPVTGNELTIALDASRDVLEWARRVVESQDA